MIPWIGAWGCRIMPRYRVIAYSPELDEAAHPDVEAVDAMAAAVTICCGPLITDGSQGGDLVAHVEPRNRPVDLWPAPPAETASLSHSR
jgi:hypothetical protein